MKSKPVKSFLTVFLFIFLFISIFGFYANPSEAATNAGTGNYQTAAVQGIQNYGKPSGCSWITSPLVCSAQAIFTIMTYVVSLSVTFFGWTADPAKMTAVIKTDNIYVCWKMVRDFLNIAFILFLLFSAFCTIFQIQKYSYKNTLLNLVLMALLVNFSYPIARFIIDVSNVLAYTLISQLFPNGLSDLSGNTAQVTALANIVNPKNSNLTQLIFIDIFLFVFAVTFFVMGILFLVRTIALAILIIFSPIAFTGSIIPGIQDKASQWWGQLFNFSFFAPIMVFMLYIAFAIMSATSSQMNETISSIASKQSNDSSWLVDLCKFIVPIVILWIGMGMGKSMSGQAGSAVLGFAKGKAIGLGKFLGKNSWKGIKKGASLTGIPGGAKQRWEQWKKRGVLGSDATAEREARMAEKFGVRGAVNEQRRKKMQEIREEWKKMGGATDAQLEEALNKGSAAHKAAAAMEMAEKNGFGDGTDKAKDLAKYKAAANALNLDPSMKHIFDDKVEEKHIRLIIANDMSNGILAPDAYEKHLGNMSADKLAKQKNLLATDEFHTNFMEAKKNSDPGFVTETAKKITAAERKDWRRREYNI